MKREELVEYLDGFLRIREIKDYGPQGLQVEGREEVTRVAGTVDAHVPCVQAAIDLNADLLLVHHGIFWGDAKPLRGAHGLLVRLLLASGINLYAAHLPLDAHPLVGNNAELARRLGIEVEDWWAEVRGTKLGVIGRADGIKFDYLVTRYEQNVGPIRLAQPHGPRAVHKVAILSGFGIEQIDEAIALGCDTFITGETSHASFYDALEHNVNVLYGGHYSSETVGVQSLGDHLAEKFGLEFTFVDLPTGL
jgi:dinuclear metal center YbgI/SA1388 family protein